MIKSITRPGVALCTGLKHVQINANTAQQYRLEKSQQQQILQQQQTDILTTNQQSNAYVNIKGYVTNETKKHRTDTSAHTILG